MENTIRTPKRNSSKKLITNNSKGSMKSINNNHNNANESTDMSKVYLAEIYTLNKRIETLTNEILQQEQTQEQQKKANEHLQEEISSKEIQLTKQIEDLQKTISRLQEQNSLLQNNHEYQEIINYYENKITEYQTQNMNTINNVTQYINKLNKNNSHYNRDDTWRKLIKTYENKINELEQKVINYEKMERKMKSRQHFFEKYCYKAEQKIEKIAKISKRYEQEHEQKMQLHKDLIQCQEDINRQKEENEKYKKEILKLKQFNNDKSKTTSPKKVNNKHSKKINNLQEWEKIKKENENHLQKLFEILNQNPEEKEKSIKNEKNSNDPKNIIMLLHNIQEFICTILQQNKELSSLDSVINIINDVKNYTIMLFDKINISNMNQCFLISTACDIYSNLNMFVIKKQINSNTVDINNVMAQMKSLCEKIISEFKS